MCVYTNSKMSLCNSIHKQNENAIVAKCKFMNLVKWHFFVLLLQLFWKLEVISK